MAFFLHRSNRQERLLDELIRVLDGPRADPFVPESIVVEGRGIERWISQQVALRHGVCCNLRFVFPRQAVSEILQWVLGRTLDLQAFEPERLMWLLARRLPERLDQPELATLRSYVRGFGELSQPERLDQRRLFALCERLARVYSDYLAYRPEMIASWQCGDLGTLEPEQHWQAWLWQQLVGDLGEDNLATLSVRAQALLCASSRASAIPTVENPGGAAPRLCLFGLSTLPPLYLNLLTAAASRLDLHLFVLSPTREYWADLQTQGEARWRARHEEALPDAPAELMHRDTGHALIASLAKQGRDLASLFDRLSPDQEQEFDEDPGLGCALHVLQSDMLHLRRRGEAALNSLFAATDPPQPLDPHDRSLRVHRCHSRMREVELLRNELLDAFDHLPDLQPGEIVILAPDIDVYAPLIDAVFGAEVQGQRLRFSVADHGADSQRALIAALTDLLSFVRGRFGAADLIELLEHPPLREVAGLSADDVAAIATWLQDCHLTWGLDAAHRQSLGAAPQAAHTWSWGLRRLLAGMAIDGAQIPRMDDLAPYDDMEGESWDRLGRLADLIERLTALHTCLSQTLPLDAWHRTLRPALHSLLSTGEEIEAASLGVDAALAELLHRAEVAGFDQAIDGDCLVDLLQPLLDSARGSQAFLRGGLTFCSLVPMRSIPFRVVALLGMNDNDFPRRSRAPRFDLIARHPQRGDRSPRDDDRTLFLDALLAARERLLITYVGHDLGSGRDQPPSVLVADLLDCLDQTFCAGTHGPASARVLVEHPRHAFDRAYFEGGSADHFSYDERLAAALASSVNPVHVRPFVDTPLSAEALAVEESLSLQSLLSFYKNPARAFLVERLGLRLPREVQTLSRQDPVELDPLQAYQIRQELLGDWGHVADPLPATEEAYRVFAAQGLLAPGPFGRRSFEHVADPLTDVWQSLAEPLGQPCQAPLELRVDTDVGTLFARISGLRAGQLLTLSASKLGGTQVLAHWLSHLMLSAALGERARSSLFADRDGQILSIAPVADAAGLLGRLIELRRVGLCQPLPFFAKSSWVYCWELAQKGDADRALWRARQRFEGGYHDGEGDDPYIGQVFAHADPLAPGARRVLLGEEPILSPEPGFGDLAVAVYGPLFRHLGGGT